VTGIIDARDITKYYRTSFSVKEFIKNRSPQRKLALSDLSFSVRKGEVFGVLGPNGSGKTTLIKIISTILIQDAGSISILGHDYPEEEKEIREHIGMCFGEYERTFHWRLTGEQNLRFFARFLGVPVQVTEERVGSALEKVGLTDVKDKLFLEYSTGMKHKLAIARALLLDPELLILDEPTAGIDFITSRAVTDMVRRLAAEGKSVIYTTHRLEEAVRVCDRIMVLKEGRKISEETPENLAKLANLTDVVEIETDAEIPEMPFIEHVYRKDGVARIHMRDMEHNLPILISSLGQIKSIRSSKPDVEDVFLRILENEGVKKNDP